MHMRTCGMGTYMLRTALLCMVLSRALREAEWRLAKACERETLLGARNMVPLGREHRASQTSYSEMYMHAHTVGSGSPAWDEKEHVNMYIPCLLRHQWQLKHAWQS